MARTRGKGTLVAMTAVAAPAALGFETLLRHLLLPAAFELVREALRPVLTPVAWALCGVCALAGVAGLVLQKRIASRSVERLPPERRTPDQVERARVGAFMLAASIPQIPAILATFSFMFGASLVPVLVAIALVTAAVLTQARRT